jgi:hypothetical protein
MIEYVRSPRFSAGPSKTALYAKPAIAAPITEANQNSQSCRRAKSPTNQRRCGTARRIHRGVRHRGADQMDQRESEARGQTRESCWSALLSGAD